MTLKELAASREKIIEYDKNKTNLDMVESTRPWIHIGSNPNYEDLKNTLEEYEKQKEKFDKLCSEYHYDELKEKANVKYVFPDITEEEPLSRFLDDITHEYYSSESSFNDALDLVAALAENPKFGDRILTEDETLMHIGRVVNLYNFNLEEVREVSPVPEEYTQIYETFMAIKLKQQDSHISEFVPIYESLLKKDEKVVSNIENNFTELKQILDQHGMEKEGNLAKL